MMTRALLIWLVLMLLAIANGTIRVAWIVPVAGEYWGQIISCITLSAFVAVVTWLTIRWIGPATAIDALKIGAAWLAMTLAFEFLAGHYLFHAPWRQLLADYNVAAGRLWILVLITTFVSPIVAAR